MKKLISVLVVLLAYTLSGCASHNPFHSIHAPDATTAATSEFKAARAACREESIGRNPDDYRVDYSTCMVVHGFMGHRDQGEGGHVDTKVLRGRARSDRPVLSP